MDQQQLGETHRDDPTGNYDNGAAGTGTSSSPNGAKPRSRTKVSRKRLMEELLAVKNELAIIRSEKDQLLQAREVNSAGNDHARRSTIPDDHHATGNESLLATMNHMSLGSLNIPECKPSEGEIDIDKKAYEHWKEIIMASFNLVHATDEHAKMDIFKIKAGTKLLEVIQGTSSTADMPDERNHPFSNAIARLDRYFGSRTYIIGQRGKLMNTVQLKGESNISFVRRVAAAAKLCDYKSEEEMEAIVRTVVKGTTDSRVRILAHRNWVNQGDMNSLIAMVRDREMEIFNEEEYQKLNRPNSGTIAAVSQTTDFRAQFRRGTGPRFRGTHRGRGAYQRGQSHKQGPSRSACWRCASMYHGPADCPNLDKVCHNCNRRGHLARTCSALSRQGIGHKRPHDEPEEEEPRPKLAAITQNGEDSEGKDDNVESSSTTNCAENQICAVPAYDPPTEEDAYVVARVAGTRVIFFIDSGAQVNTIEKKVWDKMAQNKSTVEKLHDVCYTSDKTLRAYASPGEIKVIATFSAKLHVSKERPVYLEKFYVVEEARSLLSFNTAARYSLLDVGLRVPISGYKSIWKCELATVSASVTEEFPKFNVPPVLLRYNTDMPPARNVYTHIPEGFKRLAQQKISELLSSGIIEPVTEDMDRSFCSSLLVVPKGKNDIRLVIDLRGPNKCIHRTPFRMPTFESILMELHGATWFSTIDLKNAFFHVVLDERCRHLTNFFSGDALYRCRRLPFGLCNAPDIFQEIMQSVVLSGCKGTVNYLDDVLVHGQTKEEHDRNLEEVLKRLEDHNVKINQSKCLLYKQEVTFLGFNLSASGWSIEDEKIKAIQHFRRPESQDEVRSFLGLINYIDRFIPDRADKTWRLRELARAKRFYWSEELDKEFNFLRCDAWTKIKTLGYYKQTDETELYVDASPHGLGAVLVQFDGNSRPRVIACASKALSSAEQKYPHTQKEALAMVWGVERFSNYLMSTTFKIRSDAKSNEFIFGGMHRIGKRAVSRAEAWALRLQPYDFSVESVAGDMNIADTLSRLVIDNKPADSFDDSSEEHLLFVFDVGNMEMNWNEIELEAEKDTEQTDIRKSLKSGTWNTDLRAYECQAKYLRVLGALIFKEDRVILPFKLRMKALQLAHQGHMGASAMKRILRNHFWWPGMTKEVQKHIDKCETCLRLSRKNAPLPLTTRELPQGPWEILQIDFFTDKDFGHGEFLVVVDTYSRYIHVIEVKNIDADTTNSALAKIFEVWGYPLAIQSDNGPPFQSDKFVKTWEDRGIKIRKSIPLSAQSNGAVERQNIGIKHALAAAKLDNVSWRVALEKYVHTHNKVRPLSRLGVTPFELLVGWKFRGTFPSLWESKSRELLDRTDIKEKDAISKLESKKYADHQRRARDSTIQVGDKVLVAIQKKHKSDPEFSAERFSIIARDGAKVIIRSERGVQYARNVQDVKKVPECLQELTDRTEDEDDELEITNTETDNHSSETGIELENTLEDNVEAVQRPKRTTRKPNRFKDMILYSIFE